MTQGEFIERLLAGTLPAPDTIQYIQSLSEKDLKGLSGELQREKRRLSEGILYESKTDRMGVLKDTTKPDVLERIVAVTMCVDAMLFTGKPPIDDLIVIDASSWPLPDELQTPEAQKYINRAIEAGAIDQRSHKWLLSKEMAACFVLDMNIALNLFKKKERNRRKEPNYELFSFLGFGNLHSAFNDVTKRGKHGKYERILFPLIFPDGLDQETREAYY